MAQASFVQNTTVGGVSGVYYISADVRDVSVKSIGGNLANSSYSGVNGTFFNNANELLGIAVGPNGVAVKNGGERTPKRFKRGTLFCYNAEAQASQITCSEHVVTEVTEYPGQRSWINWAIGGLSLHVRRNLGKEAYYAKVNAEESPSGIGSFGSGVKRARTFIGYKPSNQRVIMGYIRSAEAYEVRGVLIALGCTEGVMLDSGSSSQIKGKTSASNTPINVGATVGVYNMVAATPSSWA
ncbi:phosphodiester glycosidase family protein [Paenibacillus sp. UASWS1643]|uniref:phosphodiester glycosidase family protein n=1 Tax=Paenibacillus sp. UASWS1643 TaxID=2580422 RepID=UPI00168A224F|nr:phosphodiester glycosidase family protein [Paenibacillus sp. UASWS1643]